MPQVTYSRLLLLAFFVGSVFFVELGSARLWDRDEPRNARAAHEMLARGDWIVPTFNGELRDHKPVLLYWGQMLSYLALGESEFTARLPSALAGLLSVLAVALLASRLSGKTSGISHEGFWAAGCMATCLLFVMAGRAATPDSLLIAFSTLGIAALVIGSLVPAAPYSSGRVGKTRLLAALIGYTMLGLAALAKGPVGIILPLAVVHAWWLICRGIDVNETKMSTSTTGTVQAEESDRSLLQRIKNGFVWTWKTFGPLPCCRAVWALRTIPGVLLSLLAAAPWYAAVGVATDGQFLRGFFLDHNVGRALGSMEGHDGSLLFYPIAFLVGTFPWSLWLIPIVLWCRVAARESVVQRQMVILAGVWIAVYVGAFSIASTKLPSYITPCYAGAALAIGGYWRQFESAWSRPSRRVRRAAHGLAMLVGAGLSVAIIWLSSQETMPLLAQAAWAGFVIALVGALGLVWDYRRQTQRIPLTWLTGAVAFQILLFGYGAKSVDGYRSDLAALAELNEADEDRKGWLTIGGLEPSWVHYLDSLIHEVRLPESDPAAWQEVAQFCRQFPTGRVVVVGETAHENLLKWQQESGVRLVEAASAPRFLRPGNLRIFEQQPLTQSTIAGASKLQSTGPASESPSLGPIVLDRDLPEADLTPLGLPEPTITFDPASQPTTPTPLSESEEPSSRSAATLEYYPNPLRPRK